MKYVNLSCLGEVDHTQVQAPYFRAISINKKLGVSVYDVRFTQPNTEFVPADALHSIEHMLAVSLRNSLNDSFINFGLMGCQTGFYLTVASDIEVDLELSNAIEASLKMDAVPLCNQFDCGNYQNHNLNAAKKYLSSFLSSKENWGVVFK